MLFRSCSVWSRSSKRVSNCRNAVSISGLDIAPCPHAHCKQQHNMHIIRNLVLIIICKTIYLFLIYSKSATKVLLFFDICKSFFAIGNSLEANRIPLLRSPHGCVGEKSLFKGDLEGQLPLEDGGESVCVGVWEIWTIN